MCREMFKNIIKNKKIPTCTRIMIYYHKNLHLRATPLPPCFGYYGDFPPLL